MRGSSDRPDHWDQGTFLNGPIVCFSKPDAALLDYAYRRASQDLQDADIAIGITHWNPSERKFSLSKAWKKLVNTL